MVVPTLGSSNISVLISLQIKSMKLSLRLLLLSALFFATSAHAAFDGCRDYFPSQRPFHVTSGPGQLRDICFDSFAVWHSGESKTPVVVITKLNRARLIDAQNEQRSDRFYEEARLPLAHRARLEDYRGSGYDRGHMAPAAVMPTPEAMTQSFSLANITPQAPNVNRGIWANSVERATRQYVQRAKGDVFVYTGAYFQEPVKTIGAGRVWVPESLYKLVYDATDNRAWAFWVANRDDATMSRPISYEELIKRTGIEFLPGLSPAPGGGATAKPVTATSSPVQTGTPFRCGTKRTCGEMTSCAEAMFHLKECGLSRLDGDNDGVPCEKLCR